MLDKQLLGFISVALTVVGYTPYFRSVFKHKTKPHMFSWIVWAVVNAIAFIGPYSRGAGAGSWVAGFTAIICIAIAVLSTFLGEKHITRSDWIAFAMALMAMPLWCLTHDPLGSLILAILIDVAGCYPTVRKSYTNPYEENVFTWGVNGLRSLFSLFAVEKHSLVTVIFPIAMLFTNGGIALLLVWRRSIYSKVSDLS